MSSVVQFVLDGEPMELANPNPTRTVLQYLREDLRRCGTKEGCAEGDCGACTVVLAELSPDGQQLLYKALNACICFLPTLHGKALFTVESLSSGSASLHPVQQAMVDHHASQCGFCTPGFVMSLYAQYQQHQSLDRRTADEALCGNLCRCTGYRPIIDAALNMYNYPPPDDTLERRTIASLHALECKPLKIQAPQRAYYAPRTLKELTTLAGEHPDAQLVAGATDAGLWVTKQLRELPDLIYVGDVSELKQITLTHDTLSIGAAVTVSAAMEPLAQHFPGFAELFTRFASPPIRNAATLGGNIANGSPIGDSMPALIAAGARVTLASAQQTRTLQLEDFYLGYQQTALQAGEAVCEIAIPLPDPGTTLAAYKVSKRFDQDISAVCGAFALHILPDGTIDQPRVAFGGMAAIPTRSPHCEDALQGRGWDESTLQHALAALTSDFTPISDMRAGAAYRATIAANLLKRFYLHSTGHTGPLNVYDYGR
jgi:xanthine dehydrogenase small subunit